MFVSVDLEFSGFDPEKDEILEIGLVVFELVSGRAVEVERFSTLVKPTQPIKKRITAVTGLTEADFTDSPNLESVAEKVRELISGKVFVGHGTGLDLRYLGQVGIFPEVVVDTLELAQAFLPTAESYNLEFLAADLGLSEAGSHRALQDSVNAMRVFELLLGKFAGLSPELQRRVRGVAVSANLSWADFLGEVGQLEAGSSHSKLRERGEIQEYFAKHSAVVAAVSRTGDFLNLWQKGFTPFLPVGQALDPQRLESLELQDSLSPHQGIFVIKLLVWTNGQVVGRWLGELNMSMLPAGLFDLVAKTESEVPAAPAVSLVWQLPQYLSQQTSAEQVVFWGLDAAEKFLEKAAGSKISWNRLVSYVKKVQYRESFSDHGLENVLARCYASVDLFFGLLGVTLGRLKKSGDSFLLDELDLHSLHQLELAAQHASAALRQLVPELSWDEGQELERTLHRLEQYFAETPEQKESLRWVEISSGHGVLHAMPLDLSSAWQKIWSGRPAPVVATRFTELAEKTFGQADQLVLANQTVKAVSMTWQEVEQRLVEPTTKLFICADEQTLLQFYEKYIVKLRSEAATYVAGISGGPSKLSRMLRLGGKRLALLTMAQLVFGGSEFSSSEVYFLGFPEIVLTPYQQALVYRRPELSSVMQGLWKERFFLTARTLALSTTTNLVGLVDFLGSQQDEFRSNTGL